MPTGKGEQLEKDGLVQFPMVMGGVLTAAYNLDGIGAGELTFDGPTLAGVLLQVKSRSGTTGRSRSSTPKSSYRARRSRWCYRSDGSGTTFVWTDYLSKVSADWKAKVGTNTSVQFPVGIGAKGNEGVANNVMQDQGGDRLHRRPTSLANVPVPKTATTHFPSPIWLRLERTIPIVARPRNSQSLSRRNAAPRHLQERPFCSMCGPKYCSMRITEDIRKMAKEKMLVALQSS